MWVWNMLAAITGMHSVGALMHSGSWNVQGQSRWTTITWGNGNVTSIAENYDANQIVALYPVHWTVGQAERCFAPVPHQQAGSPDGKFGCQTIDPDYKAAWAKQWAIIKPLTVTGAVVGVSLGDEHLYFGNI